MRVQSIGVNSQNQHRVSSKNYRYQTPAMQNDSVSFTSKFLNAEQLKNIKVVISDIDDTLIGAIKPDGPQEVRNKVMDFATQGRVFVASSSRGLKHFLPLIEAKKLVMPEYLVANNGANIYKNINGSLEEITYWSEGLAKQFNKEKIRDFMVKIAKENPFTTDDYAKMPKTLIPDGQKEFRGSRITEYETYGSPLNIYFMMAPGVFKKTLPDIEKLLAKNGIEADVNFQNFDKNNLANLGKYFPADVAKDMGNHASPRLNADGSVDVAIISAKTNKGAASEFIRKELGLEPNKILALGDDVNDISNANKGYDFGAINPSATFDKLLNEIPQANIIRPEKDGIEGIWEIVEP